VRTQDFLFFQHLRLRLEFNDYRSKYSYKKDGMLLECLKSEIHINEKFEEYFRNDWISSIKQNAKVDFKLVALATTHEEKTHKYNNNDIN